MDEASRHKKEEAERRAKRKASKSGSRSDAQREKERKRKEHAQRILGKQNKGQSPNKRHKGSKPPPPPPPSGATPSHFQNLFTQRAQGFQIEFRFRNAPPRPPVGPCFVGHSLDGVLVERSRQYKANNAVEVNYKWKLHSEPDLGVPLAPSAMDVVSYVKPKEGEEQKPTGPLHPDDEALLNWTGSLGDTAADNLKKRQDQLRAAARLALAEGKGRIPNVLLPANTDRLTSSSAATASLTNKKAFSRVLDETMQRWMKKTTYLSNNFSRKVHDFKSLATTKQQLKQDLEQKQEKMNLRRSAQAITNTFASVAMPPKHPTKKNLKPKSIMPVLPNVKHWGHAYTHVVIDKAPNLDLDKNNLEKAFIANVEERNNNMVCQMWCPPPLKRDSDSEDSDSEEKEKEKETDEPGTVRYRPVQQFDLDVIPLKDEDEPHINFCMWVDPENNSTTYLPVSSRVLLSTGRPVKRKTFRKVARQPHSAADLEEIKEQMAEVDYDVAKEIGVTVATRRGSNSQSFMMTGADEKDDDDDKDSDGLNEKPGATAAGGADKDSDSDDSDEEETFGGMKTIVAEN